MEFDRDDLESNGRDDENMDEESTKKAFVVENGTSSKKLEYEEKEIVVLKGSKSPRVDLPKGWIQMAHKSGMPIYLHTSSRVCSASKPYSVGFVSAREYEIPMSAIPCLAYLKQQEKEKNQETTENGDESERISTIKVVDTTDTNVTDSLKVNESLPATNTQNVKDATENDSLNHLAVREYCQRRFEFKTITAKLFKKRSSRKKYEQLLKKERIQASENDELIDCPDQPSSSKAATDGNGFKSDTLLNPTPRTTACILHEFVQRSMCITPRYIIKQLDSIKSEDTSTEMEDNASQVSGRKRRADSVKKEDTSTEMKDNTSHVSCKRRRTDSVKKEDTSTEMKDNASQISWKRSGENGNTQFRYNAVLLLNNAVYGSGFGYSKKKAKAEAAKHALDALIPQMEVADIQRMKDDEEQHLKFFDEVQMGDSRITGFSYKRGQPSPYEILHEYVKRNYGMTDAKIYVKFYSGRYNKPEITMTVAKHTVSVRCKNRMEGENIAAQAILKLLHPRVSYWGCLLRRYGKSSDITKRKLKNSKVPDEKMVPELIELTSSDSDCKAET